MRVQKQFLRILYSLYLWYLYTIFYEWGALIYIYISETCIDDILPLADEYEVKCVLQKCENWLLTELELKNGKVSAQHASVKSNIKFLMKCLYYGEKYVLEQLCKKSFKLALPYRLKWYKKNEHYQMLLEENKRKLLEARLREIEKNVKKIHKEEENRFDDMILILDLPLVLVLILIPSCSAKHLLARHINALQICFNRHF